MAKPSLGGAVKRESYGERGCSRGKGAKGDYQRTNAANGNESWVVVTAVELAVSDGLYDETIEQEDFHSSVQ